MHSPLFVKSRYALEAHLNFVDDGNDGNPCESEANYRSDKIRFHYVSPCFIYLIVLLRLTIRNCDLEFVDLFLIFLNTKSHLLQISSTRTRFLQLSILFDGKLKGITDITDHVFFEVHHFNSPFQKFYIFQLLTATVDL